MKRRLATTALLSKNPLPHHHDRNTQIICKVETAEPAIWAQGRTEVWEGHNGKNWNSVQSHLPILSLRSKSFTFK
jgi:hypothetical protein